MKLLSNIDEYFSRTSGIWPLVTFRVLFGIVSAFGAGRFMAEGWIETLYLDSDFQFSFWGFSWLPRPGYWGAYALYTTIFTSAISIAFGWRFRLMAPIFVLTFAYAELLDATHYLNHYYLVILLGFLLCLTPAQAQMSMDARAGRVDISETIPSWMLHALMLQLAIVYIFAGLAKVNADWLLRAMPLAVWLPEHQNWPIIGPLLAQPWVAFAASWAGCFYDLTIIAWLLWPKTRKWAYVVVLLFHGFTFALFNIGLFPLIMSSATLLFFPSASHEALWRVFMSKLDGLSPKPPSSRRISFTPTWLRFGLGVYFALQILLPLRSALYPGAAVWGEEGYRFGWRVMLVEKTGLARFTVVDGFGNSREINNLDYLSDYQIKQMAIQPDFILQYAQHLAQVYRQEKGFAQAEVYADVWVSLNGRRSRQLIDPRIDLAAQKDGLSPKPWIIPLDD